MYLGEKDIDELMELVEENGYDVDGNFRWQYKDFVACL